MFHVPKNVNSNEIRDVNEICDQALSVTGDETGENGTVMLRIYLNKLVFCS